MSADTSGSEPAGLPRSTILVAALAIVLAGSFAFFVLQWTESRAAAAELRGRIAEVEAEAADVRQQLAAVEGDLGQLEQRTSVLQQGRFSVCNFSPTPVTVVWVAATWLAPDGQFHTFNSSEHGRDLWRVAPGETDALDYPPAGWDGTVAYFAALLKVEGQEYPYAGTWPPTEQNCVRWSPGGGAS